MQQKTYLPRAALLLMVVLPLVADLALAAPKAVGRFRDWSVFTESLDGDMVCYAVVKASSQSPSTVRHGDVWYYVTSWKSGQATNQPSFKVTYDLDPGSAPATRIGRSSWEMFVAGREAFASDADDPRIVDAIRRGSSLTVTARSARGTNVTYGFSLRGSADAVARAEAECRAP